MSDASNESANNPEAQQMADIQKQMLEMKQMMDQFNETLAPLQELKSNLDKAERVAYEEYTQKVAEIRVKKQDVDGKLYDSRAKLRDFRNKYSTLDRRYSTLKSEQEKREAAARIAAEFAALEERWDKLTAGAKWREWAKDHQLTAGHRITADNKLILADTMGLGKTLSSIIGLDMARAATAHASPDWPFLGEEQEVYDYVLEQNTTKIVGGVEKPCGLKILYLCPQPMINNVISEFRTWAPQRSVLSIGGFPKAQRNFVLDALTQASEYVVVCNYEAWRKDLALLDTLIAREFDTIIIDEAHNIKDKKSIAYRGVKQLIDNLQPPFVIPMTGTPILNRPHELHSILTLVDPKKFHSERWFLQDYCDQNMAGKWYFKPGGLDRLSKRIGKNFLRRTKEQAGIILPEKTINIHELEVDEELYPRQGEARRQMRDYAMVMLDPKKNKAITAAAKIAVYTRLRQIETWPAGIEIKETDKEDPQYGMVKMKLDIEESQKLDYIIRYDQDSQEFEGLIPEVVQDERVVVFSQFNGPLLEMYERCKRMGLRPALLTGGTSDDEKEAIRLDFDVKFTPNRKDSKYDVLLAGYKVGGAGMNLTCATQMIILDEEWNPGKRDQAYDRIHRIGQEKPVTIHVIRNKPTVDVWLAAIIEQKESVVDAFNVSMDKLNADAFDALESGLM